VGTSVPQPELLKKGEPYPTLLIDVPLDVSIPRAKSVFDAVIQIDIEFRSWMKFQGTERLAAADRGQGAVWTSCDVGQLSRTIPAHTVSPEEVNSEIAILTEDRSAKVKANSTAPAGVIERSDSGCGNGAINRARSRRTNVCATREYPGRGNG